MNGQPGLSLIELLGTPDPDVSRIINTFVTRFNHAYGVPGTDRWDITKEDWQRYEFLGDRVLNLIVAQTLFTRQAGVLDEGRMTNILSGAVSNRALDALTRQPGNDRKEAFKRLIPREISESPYGERITGGAFEAFIGALYCEVGLDDVAYFVNTIMGDVIAEYDPEGNAIGALQEYFQKKDKSLPEYRKVDHAGPAHKPTFTYEVLFNNEVLGRGSGETARDAKQAAARQALEKIGATGLPPGR
jgi:ribonuclease III